jgi:AcrR family transcriptional regulator
MFNSAVPTEKGEQTRSAILESALGLFRERGFDEARMRDIAAQAGVALGATYYYFPSKDAIVQAYYETVQADHERRLADAFAGKKLSLRERLGIVMHTKLDIVQQDRKLLGAIFRYSGEPEHPLSCLGPATRETRAKSIAVFRQAIEPDSLPADIQNLLPLAMWGLQMGVLVYFIYDRSPEQQKTRKLVDGALDLVVNFVRLFKSPLLRPLRGKIMELLKNADLVSEAIPAAAAQLVEGLQ